MSLRHYVTSKEGVSASITYIVCQDVGGGDLCPFLTALDIITLINLMADPERFKRQSPVTTDSLAVKSKRLCSDFGVAGNRKRDCGQPVRKQGYMDTCSHAMH